MEVREIIRNLYGQVLESQNLRFDFKTNLYRELDGDMEGIVTSIRQSTQGSTCTMDHIKAVVWAYFQQKMNIVNQQQFYNPQSNITFGQSNPFTQSPQTTWGQTGTFFGQQQSQPVSSFFTQSPGFSGVPKSSFFTNDKQNQPTEIVEEPKEEYVEQHWEISDKKEVLLESFDVTVSTKKCINNGVSVRNVYVDISSVVNKEEMITIASRFVDKSKPFIAQIESIVPSVVEVNPSVFTNLIKVYHERDLFGSEITANKNPMSPKIAKMVISTLLDYMDSINAKDYNKLEKYFVDQINPLIATRLINPNSLSEAYKIAEIKDLYEFYDGSIYDEFCDFEFYEQLRDIIVCTVLRDRIDMGLICDWNNIIDRMIIIKSNPNRCVGKYSLQQLMIANTSDDLDELKNETTLLDVQGKVLESFNLTVFKTPMVVTYTNIMPADMTYKFGSRQMFTPYSYVEAGNILEAIFINQKKVKEYSSLVIHPDKYNVFNCSYSPIINGSMRIGPVFNS